MKIDESKFPLRQTSKMMKFLEGDPKFSDEELDKHRVGRAQFNDALHRLRYRQRHCKHELQRVPIGGKGEFFVHCSECDFNWHRGDTAEQIIVKQPERRPTTTHNFTNISFEQAVSRLEAQPKQV
jgi:hypothetical protein